MTTRDTRISAFLDGTDWAHGQRIPLAGDASNRRYDRITTRDGRSAILMDDPSETGDAVARFVAIAGHLRANGLSAPDILARDIPAGLLLLEDLGDALFSTVIEQSPQDERPLYEAATDLLIGLRDLPAPALPEYGPGDLTTLAEVAYTEYAAATTADPPGTIRLDRFRNRFGDILHRNLTGPKVLAHRDYHAQNLIWLPDRSGLARVGLLDFQDAFIGHPAYDLVSLLQDVRRDVPTSVAMAMSQRYIDATGVDEHAFRSAYVALGAQRALRILGVFARLATRDGKHRYIDMIPRVWSHLIRNLEHPLFSQLADTLTADLPAPTPDILQKLKTR
ncbi:hypothetical protein SAMN05444007_104378 [Cribrihabitans marinus]|uniref:Aminoglycoside phosphotransferase domain-containing protein n=1 Tax=Cribrihabitans marinus TaxID=1227549 RepID=A0A1H6YPR7_9RHOB|nr:phosphotransferase [Cribrihabitans marinus]GGH29284.1 aminoglycoside phosphotransferase [Cribrihabitans marinus]SEJ40927.1 hypothetical protein SAMN05444007_104378 [Cribrihabitans marinus]